NNLYFERQHAAVGEIYSAVRTAHGYVSTLRGATEIPDLSDCNEADLRDFMKHHDFLEGKKDEIIERWKSNKMEGLALIQEHIDVLRAPRADVKLQEARNVMYRNEIYLTDR